MDYELFVKKIGSRDHANVCRFCLSDNAFRRINTKLIARLYEEITTEKVCIFEFDF